MATKIYDCIKRIGDNIVENKDFLTDLDRELVTLTTVPIWQEDSQRY